MPNLVGIGNSQVPTNAMLGDLAYQDSVDVEVLSKIKTETSDTALAIFVYDTSKDSDGGAWRKRTSHTSWYNEQLGTPERGTRKEFPAVAVCVIEDKKLTIYDGDDPEMPMWMRFYTYNSVMTMIGGNQDQDMRAVTAINGTIIVGNTVGDYNHGGIVEINFITDDALNTSHSVQKYWNLGIKLRNQSGGNRYWMPISTRSFLHSNSGITKHSLAVTVRPNAPIDPMSGMPKHIIAVATANAISVKLENGYITDITESGTGAFQSVDFTESGGIVYSATGYMTSVIQVPTADDNQATMNTQDRIRLYQYNAYADALHVSKGWASPLMRQVVAMKDNVVAMSRNDSNGFTLLQEAPTRDSTQYGMVCYITSKFNTGWLPGSCKVATLLAADTQMYSSTGDNAGVREYINYDGGNKVSNGSDWSGAQSSQSSTPPTGWTGGNGATFAVETGLGASGNYIRLYNENDGGAGPNSYMYQAITTVVGKKYKYSVTQIHHATISVHIRIGTSAGGSQISSNQWTSSSSNTPRQRFGTFTATSTTTYISLGITSGTHNYGVGWDELIVTEMDEDHSWTTIYGSNALHAYGSVTKTAVAPGAELVAYSGFSNSNYLFQQYNDALDFTDEMSIMLWVNGWTGSDSLLHRGPGTTRNSKTSFHLYCSYDYNYRITFTTNGSTEQSFEFNQSQRLRGWYQLCYTLSNGVVRGFLNGEEKTMSSTAFTGNIFSQATDRNGLWIGTGPVGGAADTASLALLRLSATAPTAEQIKKAYNDEKHLFHQNAKCTLHGSSDSVTALTYDDHNNIIHAGTSSGRSDFQGLNRINNTTTAVTTMISASNGLIAEQ